MINKEAFSAKALYLWSLNNNGLNAVVIDNEMIAYFSPEFIFLVNSKISAIRK
jgi:hypothetical protein